MSSSKKIKSGFSTVRVITDDTGRDSIPVAVVAWDSVRQWHDVRFPEDRETITGLSQERAHLVEFTKKQIRKWASEESTPYYSESAAPWETAFWDGIRRALTAGVRLEKPRPLDAESLQEGDVDALFDAVVQPKVEDEERQRRIDGLVRDALGELTTKIEARHPVSAYGGAEEEVMRGITGSDGTLVVEGINLAGRNARRDADAVTSKVMRIREANNGRRPVKAIIGYRASPNGLNGESHMRKWLKEKVTPDVYDLTRQRELLEDAAAQRLAEIGGFGENDNQETLPFGE